MEGKYEREPEQTSTKKIQEQGMETFLRMGMREQREFLRDTNVNSLKAENDPALLKKYIAMYVFMEARCAIEDKSLFNMTAQFRNLLNKLGFENLAMAAEIGSEKGNTLPGEYNSYANGYRLFHVSEIGAIHWERKILHLNYHPETFKINTRVQTTVPNDDTYRNGRYGNIQELEEIRNAGEINADQLRDLFALIQENTSYENTFGYDLFRAAIFGATSLLELSSKTGLWQILAVPTAMLLNVAIFMQRLFLPR